MKHFTVSVLALSALAVGACSEQIQTALEPDQAVFAKAAGGGGSTVPSVSLKVAIAAVCPAATDAVCRIRSDKDEAYRDGEQNVKAVFDSYGNFIFDTNTSRTSAIRHIVHDFSRRYGTAGTTAGAPEPDNTRNFHFATMKSQLTNGKVDIQTMDVLSTQCLALGSGYTLKSNSKLTARLSFHRGQEDNVASPTAYAVFRRTGADTWTMTPDRTCPNVPLGNEAKNDDVGAVRNDDGTALHGYYHLPFIFTLTRKS